MNVVPLRGLPDQDRLPPSGSELRRAIGSCRQAFIGVALMSGMINLLYLTGSFFMLEVYDRVLPSRSVPTLVGLLVIAAVLYVFQGLLDICRGRVLTRIGGSLDETLHERVYDVLIRQPLKKRTTGDGLQAIRDLDQIRHFLSGIGPTALFDLPWMPLYLAICFLFHPLDRGDGCRGRACPCRHHARDRVADAPAHQDSGRERGNAQRARAGESPQRRGASGAWAWVGVSARSGARPMQHFIEAQQRSSDVAGGLGAVSKVLRMALQSAMLGVGAYLVIEQQATAGIIIASSILTSRALAPVELAIANWRGFVAARQSWKRLRELFAALPERAHPLALPRPSATLSVEGASAVPPGGQRFVAAGRELFAQGRQRARRHRPERVRQVVAGARCSSASGRRVRGKVRLDGAALDQWEPDALGEHIGYLPQDVELFAGTVAENIARFEPEREAGGGHRGGEGRRRP